MEDADWTRLESALVESAEALVHRSDTLEPVSGLLSRLTTAAVGGVPGTSYVGMTMRDPDRGLISLAPSHPDIVALDRVQADLGEGPCVAALSTGQASVVEVVDFATETRWPRFAAAARDAGMRSLLSHALAPRGAAPGAVNFYAGDPAAFSDPATRAVAGAFAMQAAVAVYGSHRATQLTRALATRDVIGRAKGILMERFSIDDGAAFDLLVRSSQETNVKLVDVAQWLNDEIGRRTPASDR